MVKAKLADIQKWNESFDMKDKFYLDKENDVYLEYYLKFSDKKINEIFEELYKTITYCESKKLDDFNDNEYMYRYYQFLLVKHFASLRTVLAKKDYEFHKKFMKESEDNGLIKTFIDYVFDREEVNKAMDRYNEKHELGAYLAIQLDQLNIEHLQGIKQVVN